MNLPDWPTAHREALARFYAAGHIWTWQQMRDGDGSAAVHARRWIESSPAPPEHPLLLPRIRGEQSIWYAIAFDDRRFEALREELNAFLGSAGTDFNGMRAELDLNDPAEAVLAEWPGPRRVFRLNVIDKERKNVRTALNQLLTVYRLKPARRPTAYRTTEALLREFFAALVNHDEEDATRLLSQLHDSGRLSAENLNFLKVERHAALGRWIDIVQMPEISLLARVTRPRHVTALIAEALWRVDLEQCHEDPRRAVDYFRAELQGQFQTLFRTRQGITNPSALLMFALAAAAAQPANRNEIEAIVTILSTPPEAEFVRALLALFPAPAEPATVLADPLARARSALDADRYDDAWSLGRGCEASSERCKILIACAVEIATAEAAAIAVEALDNLADADRNELLKSNRRARDVQQLRALIAPTASLAGDWETWFTRLDEDPEAQGLVELARQSTEAWPVCVYRTNPARVSKLAKRLTVNRSVDATRVEMLVLPHFLRYFLQEGTGEREFLPIYKELLLLLACSDAFSESDWMTGQTLLESVLAAGADRETYRDAVEAMSQIWQMHGSVQHVDWALDTIDLLAVHRAQDEDALTGFVSKLLDTFRSGYRRIERHQWAAFQVLSVDLGKTDEFNGLNPPNFKGEATATGATLPDLGGRKVGIYTLTDAAGRHAAAALEQLFPGIDVRLNHDTVATAPLMSLARQCDYLIVTTDSSKHAATNALKANRPARTAPLIYAAGKGSSSIIAALLSRLATLSTV